MKTPYYIIGEYPRGDKVIIKESGHIYDVNGILFGAKRDEHNRWIITLLLNGQRVCSSVTKAQIVPTIEKKMPAIKERLKDGILKKQAELFFNMMYEEALK